jgi:hypothetical protein
MGAQPSVAEHVDEGRGPTAVSPCFTPLNLLRNLISIPRRRAARGIGDPAIGPFERRDPLHLFLG